MINTKLRGCIEDQGQHSKCECRVRASGRSDGLPEVIKTQPRRCDSMQCVNVGWNRTILKGI